MWLTRRDFLAAAGAAGLSLAAAGRSNRKTLRVIAYNVFGCVGWPKNRSRAMQAVAEGRMARNLARALARQEPDIINFSESPDKDVLKGIADQLEMFHVQFPSAGDWPGAVLSRFEIENSENAPSTGERAPDLFTRHWGRAAIKLPDYGRLVVHSAHLHPTDDPTIRMREIGVMLETMKPDLASHQSMLLMGDLNHGPDSKEYEQWKKAGWVDAFAQVGKGNGFTFRSDIPQWRIDYVMAAGPIVAMAAESKPLNEGEFRLDLSDKEAIALSDHLPQLAVFRLAE